MGCLRVEYTRHGYSLHQRHTRDPRRNSGLWSSTPTRRRSCKCLRALVAAIRPFSLPDQTRKHARRGGKLLPGLPKDSPQPPERHHRPAEVVYLPWRHQQHSGLHHRILSLGRFMQEKAQGSRNGTGKTSPAQLSPHVRSGELLHCERSTP